MITTHSELSILLDFQIVDRSIKFLQIDKIIASSDESQPLNRRRGGFILCNYPARAAGEVVSSFFIV